MKFTIVTTPIHDAISITANILPSIEAEVLKIAMIRYDSFIEDVDTLTVALYASHPSACSELLKMPDGDLRKLAAENAKALHFNPCSIPHLATTGYFNEQLRKLLTIARSEADYGSKLVQVFLTMLEHIEEHHLDDHLVGDLQRFVAMKDFSDGYVLIEQADDEYLVIPSLWRR